jgi:hypothetical protein
MSSADKALECEADAAAAGYDLEELQLKLGWLSLDLGKTTHQLLGYPYVLFGSDGPLVVPMADPLLQRRFGWNRPKRCARSPQHLFAKAPLLEEP